MIVLDIIIAAILGFGIYKGLQKGLVVAVISLFALVVGIYISLRFSFYTRDLFFVDSKMDGNTITIASFFITFLSVLIGLFFLGKVLTKMISAIALGFLNRIGGAVFEGVKMLLIVSVFINLFQKINFNHIIISEEKLTSSIFFYSIEDVSKKVFPLMEKWYQETLTQTMEAVEKLDDKK